MFKEFYFTVSSSDIRPYMRNVPVLFPTLSTPKQHMVLLEDSAG